jgi:hypothetical protein
MKQLRRRVLAVAGLATLLVGGCGTTPTPAPASTPPAPTAVPTSSATLPPFACGEAISRPGTVPTALLDGIAAANEGGVGRITFTFRPAGNVAALPTVDVQPATPPFTMDPSGLPLDVAGTQFVAITLTGGTALDAEFNPTYEGPFDFALDGSPIVEMRRTGDFEAVSTFVVGLAGPSCVRILPPDGSGRVVVEVRASAAG